MRWGSISQLSVDVIKLENQEKLVYIDKSIKIFIKIVFFQAFSLFINIHK